MTDIVAAWRAWDARLIRVTEFLLFSIGATFTALVVLEVVSRFIFSFSIFFTNAMARYLLVWFFLLGAGPALRRGAHVGFDMLIQALPLAVRRRTEATAHVLVLVFFVLMIWGGLVSLPQAWAEIDSAMGVRSVWGIAAIPVGFVLLLYHQACVMVERRIDRDRQGV